MDQPVSPPPAQRDAAPARGPALQAPLETWSTIGMIVALLLLVQMHLVAALISALLVYELVEVLTPMLRLRPFQGERAKFVAVTLLATAVVALLTLAVVGAVGWLREGGESLPVLMQKLAEIIDGSRALMPAWVLAYLPADAKSCA